MPHSLSLATNFFLNCFHLVHALRCYKEVRIGKTHQDYGVVDCDGRCFGEPCTFCYSYSWDVNGGGIDKACGSEHKNPTEVIGLTGDGCIDSNYVDYVKMLKKGLKWLNEQASKPKEMVNPMMNRKIGGDVRVCRCSGDACNGASTIKLSNIINAIFMITITFQYLFKAVEM